MFEFEKICKEYETLSYDERRDVLSTLAGVILPEITKVTGGTTAFEMLVMAACAASGGLTVAEYSLFKDATGLEFSYDQASEIVDDVKGRELEDAADELVDSFGDIDADVKSAMVSFCLCICSADSKISLKERRFIKKLIRE